MTRRAEIDRLRLEDPIIAAALAHADAGGLSYQDALELAVITYSGEMRSLKAKLLALASGLPDPGDESHCYVWRRGISRHPWVKARCSTCLWEGRQADLVLHRDGALGCPSCARTDGVQVSAFPPCAACGASYEAHEEVGIAGERGHRINGPVMPQHGVYHDFTPLPPRS